MSQPISSAILTASGLRVEYGTQKVLDGASLTIHEGDRIGLLGRNGAGKTTFLKVMSGMMQPDAGLIAAKRNLRVAYLPQEFELNPLLTARENVLEGADYITSLLKEYETLPPDAETRHILEEKISFCGGWDLDRNLSRLAEELSAPVGVNDVRTLSGGEKRRVALCRALIGKPELLILDEPTNHLDTAAIEWLEHFLIGFEGTCIFVTHDRYFLDRIANRIVELNSGIFYSHTGNYTAYLSAKAERKAIEETAEKKRRNFIRRELDWVNRGPKARRTKAKSRMDAFTEISAIQGPEAEVEVELILPPAPRLGKKVLELSAVEMRIGERTLFDCVNINFIPGKRVGIIGRNGCGKTTLLRVMLGDAVLFAGTREVGENTQFNYIDQARLLLNDDETVFYAIGEGNDFVQFGKETLPVWTYLRRFLFTDDRIETRVGRLSGGERSRLTLAKILKTGGNFLLLDEPTNDLDLPTLRVLEEALIAFEGCAAIVSHDRYFLNRVCDTILAFEEDGKLIHSEGDYDYYLEKRARRLQWIDSEIKEKKADTRVRPHSKKLSWKETKELEGMEEAILHAEAEIERIDGLFSSPDFYMIHSRNLQELREAREAARQRAAELYIRWQELDAKLNAWKQPE